MAQNLINALSLGSLYALIALGIALLFSIMGLINFAHGELITIGGYTLLAFHGLPLAVAVALTVAVVVAAALTMERLAFRPARGASGETLLMTSFALSLLVQGGVLLKEGADPQSVNVLGSLGASVDVGGMTIGKLDVAIIGVTGVLLIGLAWFLRATPLGVQMRAAAEDFTMARALGVRADRVVATAFGVSGAFAAVAAVFLVARTGTLTPSMGLTPVLLGFVAIVLGGLGRLWAAAIGAYVLALLSVMLQAYLPTGLAAYRDALVYLGIIVILLFRPHGIAGRPQGVRV
ncbi:branched-chain amino acid ABC transporter permease [Nocardioides marmoriginsengisoli]|uniref:Branched-chain amino acid ABC transporter permease n=1 Tax=Nocardioides marmoriginsengisoli TaxID=661483 RepID=A0A3N0CGP7_9ACTN|nr:branched-chain amino acid ABC transporter permease [Nocardioides marmoriginsengisoli]RNL62608.1 branched-chain amino acid ABC transporter permease [Nocardioides marmoriginsengisoli]